MNIARSTFYYRCQTAPSGDAAVTDRIEAIPLAQALQLDVLKES